MVPSDSLIIEAERHAGWRRRKMEGETEGERERDGSDWGNDNIVVKPLGLWVMRLSWESRAPPPQWCHRMNKHNQRFILQEARPLLTSLSPLAFFFFFFFGNNASDSSSWPFSERKMSVFWKWQSLVFTSCFSLLAHTHTHMYADTWPIWIITADKATSLFLFTSQLVDSTDKSCPRVCEQSRALSTYTLADECGFFSSLVHNHCLIL